MDPLDIWSVLQNSNLYYTTIICGYLWIIVQIKYNKILNWKLFKNNNFLIDEPSKIKHFTTGFNLNGDKDVVSKPFFSTHSTHRLPTYLNG